MLAYIIYAHCSSFLCPLFLIASVHLIGSLLINLFCHIINLFCHIPSKKFLFWLLPVTVAFSQFSSGGCTLSNICSECPPPTVFFSERSGSSTKRLGVIEAPSPRLGWERAVEVPPRKNALWTNTVILRLKWASRGAGMHGRKLYITMDTLRHTYAVKSKRLEYCGSNENGSEKREKEDLHVKDNRDDEHDGFLIVSVDSFIVKRDCSLKLFIYSTKSWMQNLEKVEELPWLMLIVKIPWSECDRALWHTEAFRGC